jgi:uncharacterized iron-regulated protein
VFNAVNGIAGQKAESYAKMLGARADQMVPASGFQTLAAVKKQWRSDDQPFLRAVHDPRFSSFVVAQVTFPQIRERIADASAALYILSNYGDTPETRAFLREVIDLRSAYFEDVIHDTASSLQGALDAFSNHPAKELSIVKTTAKAAEIIKSQPEFTRSIEDIATDIRNKFTAKEGLITRWHRPYLFRPGAESRQTIARSITNARNRACDLTK